MRIRKVILDNFRIYHGECPIEFPRKEGENIHLVTGKNGFGKTTFLTSLIWCLYGKAMGQVEEKYRNDIKVAGGYEAFLHRLGNKHAFKKEEAEFSVTLFLEDLLIPSIPCNTVVIKRTYYKERGEEKLLILIDGAENELTKEVGYEVFINDFILPREIAKFFFFDAEKIVSLAEAKSKDELRSLSRAYSEVLGIKKYEDLKKSLGTIISKLKKNGADEQQRQKLNVLQEEMQVLEGVLKKKQERLEDIEEQLESYRNRSAAVQEELIREGSELTTKQLNALRADQKKYAALHDEAKADVKQLLEMLPFSIAKEQFKALTEQLNLETKLRNKEEKQDLIDDELRKLAHTLEDRFAESSLKASEREQAIAIVQSCIKQQIHPEEIQGKMLLNFDRETVRSINSLFDYIDQRFDSEFKKATEREKEIRFQINKIKNALRQGEARKNNTLVQELRRQKDEYDERIEHFASEKGGYETELQQLSIQYTTKKKVLSEFENKVGVLSLDLKKYEASQALLKKLQLLTSKIKEEKKHALEKSVLLGLNKLLHKNHLVQKVSIRLEEEVMNIDLLDADGQYVVKDDLSKGEQQLYATALLKALVDQSGIDFPVFIDSPLQKFDKEHSSNVIQEFYPSIAEQVVLFPLLEKELSRQEFQLLNAHLGSTHLIENSQKGSTLQKHPAKKLFDQFNLQHDLAY